MHKLSTKIVDNRVEKCAKVISDIANLFNSLPFVRLAL
jgi:hypothetical protein